MNILGIQIGKTSTPYNIAFIDSYSFNEIASSILAAKNSILNGKIVCTRMIGDDIGGSINNTNNDGDCCVFQYSNIKEQELSNINQQTKKFKTGHGGLNIVLVGAQVDEREQEFNLLTDKLKEFKNNISFLWGQRDGGTTQICNIAKKQTLFVNHLSANSRDVNIGSLDDVKRIFTKSEFAKGIKLIFQK